jgi:signal transduction histidine kinase
MKKLWNKISYNGIDDQDNNSYYRELIILNQLNFFIFVLFAAMLILLTPGIIKAGIKWDSIRIFLIIALTVVNFFFNSKGFFSFSKISLIAILPLLLLILPTILGDVIDEYFFWYPLAAITFSLIPHFIFNYTNEKKYLLITLFFYLILVITIEHILFSIKSNELKVFPIIKDNFRWIKLVHLFLFGFINIAFYYTFTLIKRFELSIKEANENLSEHKEELEEKNCELETLINKLKETQSQLYHSDKMASIGVLASGVSHEINNPLNYISGSIQAINKIVDDCAKGEVNEAEIKENISSIKSLIISANSGVEKVSEIVSSLSTFSYRGESQLIPTDLNKLIDSTLLLTRSNILTQIEVQKNYSQLPIIQTYQDDIHQLIYNILDNASVAIHSKKSLNSEKIIITTLANKSIDKGFITIIIANTGPKIQEETIHKIFDPFFTTKDSEEATGLGLTICYNIAKKHNGLIFARNNGDLVEFVIELPVN